MPGKSKSGRRKSRTNNYRKSIKKQSSNLTVQQYDSVETTKPAFPLNKADSSMSVPITSEVPETESYKFVIRELKEIGILTIVMLILLFLAALLWK